MKTKPILYVAMLLVVSACGQPEVKPATVTSTPKVEILPTVTPVCVSSEPTQADINRALSFTGGIFEIGDWTHTYSVSDSRVSVSWLSDSLVSVAFLEAQIFPCGYEGPDLDKYFNNDYWEVIFENYQDYELINECRTVNGLRLYEFDVLNADVEYFSHYWSVNDTDHRIITLMLVAPDGYPTLDDYSRALFPQLNSCQ